MNGFNDLLDEIRSAGGLLVWITQKKNFLQNIDNPKRAPEQIKQKVLQSDRLKHVIEEIINKQQQIDTSNLKREDIQAEAKKILDEMAHNFDLKYVRFLGYILMKVFSSIFKHIYYNSDLESNLQVLKHYPVVLLPLHRSYMDFLLVSIVCFHKNIQLPGIAAGQDFLGLSFMSRFIRNAGGFFIRRSFGSDELYWAIFHEYVQQHLLNCDRPLEFFIEGTRSRTSKSLPPKFGMISTCIELYTKHHRIEDLYFVPISLTYEKLLEEMLYANELLGVPKPKETVSGLVKARQILKQNYGSIFVNFSRPISLREYLYYAEGPVSLRNPLTNHTLTPSFIFELNKEQNKEIQLLSYTLLLDMLKNQIIQPISILSTCVLAARNQTISLELIAHQMEKLKRILQNLGAQVYWPRLSESFYGLKITSKFQEDEFTRAKLIVLDNIETHSNLFDLEYQPKQINDYNKCIELAKYSGANFQNSALIIRLKQNQVSFFFINFYLFLSWVRILNVLLLTKGKLKSSANT
jgi:glycerone phosphate O-acyltransferase